jgi:2-keto-4-pentenoate hydratase/2-oxohepta-3-ene-1,7-dioic acid hydratase in catechol pathway
MRAFLLSLMSGFCLLALGALLTSIYLSRPLFTDTLDPRTATGVSIAPVDQALTFARYREGGAPRILLVRGYAADSIVGVDLTAHFDRPEADALGLFREFGYEALARAAGGALLAVELAKLEVPFEGHRANIGIGANYLEHARESQVDEQPFVFPKLAQPTRFSSTVSRSPSVLLDYEAELGLVPLEDIAGPEPVPRTMGLVLCNELTDRWTLVRHYSRDAPMGTTGFVEGKSRDGFAVTGPLLVIPRDLDAFYRQITLRLYVNGRLRQQDSAGEMVWGPREILGEIFRRKDWAFRNHEGRAPLLDAAGRIPAGTVIFSGTPAGVIFKPHNLWNPWLYLRPGDEVVIRADALGVIRNRIVD